MKDSRSSVPVLALLLLLGTAWPAPLEAEGLAPRFALPVACAIGTDCVVQNYLDHEPGPGAKDQTCGPLTYDGHRGIDFRLPGLRDMMRGVAVLAAAPGVVLRVRDGEPDISFRARGEAALRGREAGNGVVIDHGGGWHSQYIHLRNGSVAVAPGDRVAAGTRLGLIGLSGKTEFPHLHFGVTLDERILDPFTGRPPESGCGQAGTPLWNAEALAALAYRAGGLLAAGFAAGPLDLKDALGEAPPAPPGAAAPALVFWAAAWGLRAGDLEEIEVTGPDGTLLARWSDRLERNMAQSLRYAGAKLRGPAWPAGIYRGTYRVTRADGAAAHRVIETERRIAPR